MPFHLEFPVSCLFFAPLLRLGILLFISSRVPSMLWKIFLACQIWNMPNSFPKKCLKIRVWNSFNILEYYIQFFFFFFFLGLSVQHMEVPRLGWNQSCSCQPTPQPQERRIWAVSATCATAHGNAISLTHWVRPRIEPTSSWILVRLITIEPQWELPCFLILIWFFILSFISILSFSLLALFRTY